ncbi:uncharacterized protein FYW47_010820 [Aplochiton taeniatus]
MFQFSKYPMDILEMLSGHQAHQFKGLGLERQLQHQQQVQLQHQQQLQQQHQPPGETSGSLLSGLGLGSLQGSRSQAFADSSSIFAKMSAPPPPISHQSQSSSSHSSRKSSKMSSSSGSGSSSSGYPQFLRPFHPAEAALAQEQLHSGMGRFDFGGSSSGGVVTSAPPPPPLHPGLSVPQPSPGGPSSASPSPSTSSSSNPSGSSAVASLGQPLVGQSDPRSLHQQFSCMLAANQYFLSGVPTNSSLEQFLVQQGTHNHLGLGLGQGAGDSNSLAPPPALHSSHSHGHPTPQQQQQQQQLPPHALSHPHSHTHHPHPLHPAPQPAPLGGFDFQGIPVLSSNQIASLMQQEAASGLPLPLPLHLSLPKDEGKGDSGSGSSGSGGSRRKKAMAGYLPQRKSEGSSHSSSSNCHSSSSGHSQNSSSGLVGGGSGGISVIGGEQQQHSSLLSPSAQQQSSSTVVSSSSSARSSASTSVLVANGSQQLPKSQENLNAMASSGSNEPEPLYHCGECGKTFTHLSSLRRHLRSHGITSESSGRKSGRNSPSPERTFCCGECGKGFKKRGHLLQHSVTHSGNRPFACSICQKSFNRRESLTRHEKIHDEKPFRCPACGRCFRESTSLLNHAASGTCGKPPRSAKNRGSGDGSSNPSGSKMGPGGSGTGAGMSNEGKYATDYSRNRYQPQYGSAVDDYRRSQSNQSSLYSGDSSLGNGMGSQTLRKAPLAPTLHPHPQSQQQQQQQQQQHHHHQQQPHLPLSSLLDDSEDEVTSSAMSAIAAAAAASCDINTESRGVERRDIIGGLLGGLGFGGMGGPSSTSGSRGDQGLISGSTIPLTHPSHPNAKPKRPRKPRQKREPGAIVRRRRSSGPRGDGTERPHVCNVCGKRFRRGETLRRHDRVHTGEKPHACDVCGKTFREAFHLTKHLTVHSGQKNYKCNLCGKVFAYAQSLVRHGKLHRKGEIDASGVKVKPGHIGAISQVGNAGTPDYYTFPSDKSPAEDPGSSSQPSQRLYTCTVCWKSFRHHFHLTAHQQTVHGGGAGAEKSFRCEVCGKAFAYSNSLVRHRLSQHGIGRAGGQANQAGGSNQGAQPTGFSPLFYESGSGSNSSYQSTSTSHMPLQASQSQQHSFQYRTQNFQRRGGVRKNRKKKRRVVIHSIMRDGKLVGVPLSKATRRKLRMLRKKRGRLQQTLARKKLLAQLRIKGGGMNVKAWCGGAVKVTGLNSMEVPIKRFPCPICPSTTYAKQASLLVHHAIRHPPSNSGRQARLKCQVCGKRSRTLRKALRHRGRHLAQGSFACPKCRSRFWNQPLLSRHRISCRGSAGGSGNWGMKVMSPSHDGGQAAQQKIDGRNDGHSQVPPMAQSQVHSPVQIPPVPALVQPERSTVLTEYSQ